MKRVYRILLQHSVAIFCAIYVFDLSYIHAILCLSSCQILATPLYRPTYFICRPISHTVSAVCRFVCRLNMLKCKSFSALGLV